MWSEQESDQAELWAGQFGDDYTQRNTTDRMIDSNVSFFEEVLSHTGPLSSVTELGCNAGMNLRALHRIDPRMSLTGVDVNRSALARVEDWGGARTVAQSITAPLSLPPADMAFTKGVLIHISPGELPAAYDNLLKCSHRFVLVAEYHSPTPVEIPYRGHRGALFKRDFGGELLDYAPGLTLVDYGFRWRRDPRGPQDDLTWFLLSKP